MKLRLLLSGLGCIGILTLSSGCMWARMKTNDPDVLARARLVRPQVTRASELANLLGQPPNSVMPTKNGLQMYVYTAGDSKTMGFNIIVLSVSKTNMRMDSVYIFVDEQGLVQKVVVGKQGEIPWEWWAFGD